MHSVIRGKCKKVLHKHIGSNMEALFKVDYHSLRLFFINKNKKPLIYMWCICLWGEGPSIKLSFCIKFSFVIMSSFLFPFFFFSFHTLVRHGFVQLFNSIFCFVVKKNNNHKTMRQYIFQYIQFFLRIFQYITCVANEEWPF